MTNKGGKLSKKTAANGRFGASGGVGSSDTLCRTATSALVQMAVEAPPAPSRWALAATI